MAAPIEAPWLLGTMWMAFLRKGPCRTADGAFNDTGDTGDFFDKAAFNGNGLLFEFLFAGQMAENAEAGSADHLCRPRKDVLAQGTETFLFVPASHQSEDVADRLFTGEEFIHAARRKTRNVVTIQIIHQNNAEELVK